MKLYEKAINDFNLSYEEAFREAEKGSYITREVWSGFHFYFNGDYYIITKDREIIKNPTDIFDKDKRDWGTIMITGEGIELVERALQICQKQS